MVYKWKEEHTPLFLEHFKNYPCLWDFKTEGYKNKEARANAIRNLIQNLNLVGVTEEDIKLKIKSIRTRYTCELAKIKRSIQNGCCSSEDVYVPKLFWFQQADQFLNAVCVPRESSTSSNFSISDEQLHMTIKENPDEACQDSHQPQDLVVDLLRVPKSRKRCYDTPMEREVKQQKIVDNYYPINKTTLNEDKKPTTEDEFDLFCRSLAVQLKNMPLHRALICQQDLLAVMVQERLQSLHTTSPSQAPFNSVDR